MVVCHNGCIDQMDSNDPFPLLFFALAKCMGVYALQYRSETLQKETINVHTGDT